MNIAFVLQIIWAFALVALLLIGFLYIARAIQRTRIVGSVGRRLISTVESTALAQHVAVHVVKVGERYLLVGGGSNGTLSLLAELPPDEVDAWLAAQRDTLGKASWQNFMGSLRPRQ